MNEAEKLLKKIRTEIDEYFTEPEPVPKLILSRKEDHIIVEWEGIEVEEIQWVFGERNWVSLQKMWRSDEYNPPPITGNSYKIGNVKNINENLVVVVGRGKWNEDAGEYILDVNNSISEELEEKDTETDPDHEKIKMDFGFWYAREILLTNELQKLCTVGQDRNDGADDIEVVKNMGLKVIPSLGGFQNLARKHPQNWERKFEDRIRYQADRYNKYADDIYFINLEDEPRHLPIDRLEYIVAKAKEHYPGIPSTFMHTRGMLLRGQFARNLTHVGCNVYPYFEPNAPSGYVQVWDYADFKKHLDNIFHYVRKEIPNVKLIITAQAFYKKEGTEGNPWRPPHPDAAYHYIRYAKERGDIICNLFWTMRSIKNWVGLEEMPEQQNAWIQEIKKHTIK